jgi:putative addiction module component (TIGR02574 family)
MSPLLKRIEDQARALSAEDRARLAETVQESLQPSIADIEAAWAKEIEDRVNAFDHDDMSAHCAAEVCGEARQSLR